MLSSFTERYDVVAVGAGHAGCEAGMAAARMGLKTPLYTVSLDLTVQISCNPAEQSERKMQRESLQAMLDAAGS
jgi:tRNA U34 5-carboxymethylaminomethyl modifying enzyme MnmG/GidA